MTNKGKKQEKKPQLPFVSVCTPTFNRRPFIENMFECFRNQTYPKHRIEWIIVDDGTDKIRDLIESSNIPQIRYFEINEKLSLGAKRNYMHRYVRGDIVVYMDDDDYYPPERIEDAVEKLQANPKALCAGSSEIYIYFKHIQKMYKCGPYNANHATAGTFAFRKELLNVTKYDETAAVAEERAFLKDYTIPFVQLDPMKAILVFSHIHNTFDKRKMLDNQHPDFFRECDKTVEMFIRKKSEKKIYDFFMKNIDGLLEKYEPGEPKMKPDVLKQIKEIEEQRDKMIQEEMEKQKANGQIMLQQPGKPPIPLSNQEVVNMIQQQQQQLQSLGQRCEQNDKTIQLLQSQLVEKTKKIRELSTSNGDNANITMVDDQQISKLENMIINLQKQLIEKTKTIRELNTEKEKLTETIKNQESSFSKPIVLDTETTELQNMINALQRQLIDKTKTIRELISDKDNIIMERDNLMKEKNTIHSESENKNNKNEELQTMVDMLQNQLNEKSMIIHQLNKEKEINIHNNSNIEDDSNLSSKIQDFKNTILILQKQLIEKTKQVRELTIEKDLSQTNNKNMEDINTQSSPIADSDAQNTIIILRRQLIEKNKIIREFHMNSNNEVNNNQNNSKNEPEILTNNNETLMKKNNEKMNETIIALQKQLVDKSKRIRELMEENEKLTKDSKDNEQNTIIKNNMQSYINTLQEQLKEKSKLLYQLTDTKEDVQRFKTKVSELENIITILKQQISDKNKELLQLKQRPDSEPSMQQQQQPSLSKMNTTNNLPSFVRIPIQVEDNTTNPTYSRKGKSDPEISIMVAD